MVLQALISVPQIRSYFLREENYSNIKVAPGDIMIGLIKRFGELVRKVESAQLQSSCESTRNATGGRQVQQKKVSDHRTK